MDGTEIIKCLRDNHIVAARFAFDVESEKLGELSSRALEYLGNEKEDATQIDKIVIAIRQWVSMELYLRDVSRVQVVGNVEQGTLIAYDQDKTFLGSEGIQLLSRGCQEHRRSFFCFRLQG